MSEGFGIEYVGRAPRTSAPPPPERGSRLTERLPVGPSMDWRERGACVGKPADWFFADEKSQPTHYRRAATLCAVCPVRADCLSWAMDNNERWGFWGGTTPNERISIFRDRWRERAQPSAVEVVDLIGSLDCPDTRYSRAPERVRPTRTPPKVKEPKGINMNTPGRMPRRDAT